MNAYQPNAVARKVVQLLPGFSTVDANGQSRVFGTSVVGGTNASSGESGDSVVITTRSDYELGASGNLLSLHTVDNFGRDEREYHHEFGFVDNLGNRTLFARDMLGSVRATLKNGTMVEWNDYYAYGAVRDSWSLANGRWLYNGHEFDNETGTLNFGWRQHDALIGRFTSIDRLSAKYPHLSPYQYGGNNPMTTIDVNGDSILVVINGQNYYWGQFTVPGTNLQGSGFLNGQTGEVYSGNDAFVRSVTTALLTMSVTEAGGALISNVAASEVGFTLTLPGAGKGNETVYSPKVREIRWDPNNSIGGIDQRGSQVRPAWVGLGHELGHAWSNILGYNNPDSHNANQRPWVATAKFDEIYASHWENMIRSQAGLPLREFYSIQQNGSAEPRTRLIDTNGHSLYFDKQGSANTQSYPQISPGSRFKYRP